MTLHIDPASIAEARNGPTRYQMLIGGEWVDGAIGLEGERVSPGHGVVVSRYAFGSEQDVERAVVAARRAFHRGPWPKMKASERAAVLLRTADLIEANLERIARLDAIESGKPIRQARGEIAGAADIWRYAASLARTLHGESYANLGDTMLGVVLREPIGVVSIITPWNFPFLIVAQKLPFALAAGCTAVVKPSEMTSASTVVLGELLIEAGIPEGVVNIVLGTGPEVGAHMVAHPSVDMVSFTGSTRVGKATVEAAAKTLKKVSMELGGKNAQIVFPDADLEAAVDAAVFGAFFNAGECCNAGSRLVIHQDIAKDFLAAFAERAKRVKVGDPLDEATDVGAIITPAHLAKIANSVSDAAIDGASILIGGEAIATGAGQYMAPTVVAGVKPEMTIAREEVFGPVLSVLEFAREDEAIRLVEMTDYGLSAGVWSRNIDTAMHVARSVRTGTVWVNTFMDGYPELPFGGMKQSGIGRELGKNAVEDYSEAKTIQFHRGPRTAWWVGN
ncbi:aldehyde dehydrogenase family protein [Kaistia dalseonensis]|uniref:Acyl-CoA reductase-like NAD-dependent aldehyde dehydrogenase n=1 Tax=Kaistia dalseonensis TaxID=410840 RepID=A0ABU0HDF0_9HYPH|nr:aldehyde dehydrogenase family protein [Kaistia dalseonensis]MCX5497697.1 aldehyde dehydrogenase family protein [Kaistia dalseonensis]MDQ0440341.1 acyl-CoA reductase-like NAD-dependent aldehyde dehydrogenase [Kaistia dalseonensis]